MESLGIDTYFKVKLRCMKESVHLGNLEVYGKIMLIRKQSTRIW
jgi:hypothetical protein